MIDASCVDRLGSLINKTSHRLRCVDLPPDFQTNELKPQYKCYLLLANADTERIKLFDQYLPYSML